jgi:hypothetical protein
MPENGLSQAQLNALKDLAILGAVYLGAKTASAVVRYSIIAGVGYLLYRNFVAAQASPGMAGMPGDAWKVKVDPGMAVDMLFPGLEGTEKHFARLAASHVLNGLISRGGPGFSMGGS